MLLAAGMALILFCVVGIAAVLGWIPSSIGRSADQAEVVAADRLAADKATAAVAEKPRRVSRPAPVLTAPVRVVCANCGVIDSIRAIETSGQGSGVGAVGGAVVGGLLGNQVGGGSGKDAMTVVGAIGGALAGNHIEKRVKSISGYEVVVRMDDGSSRVIHEADQPAWRRGDHVKVVNGAIRSS